MFYYLHQNVWFLFSSIWSFVAIYLWLNLMEALYFSITYLAGKNTPFCINMHPFGGEIDKKPFLKRVVHFCNILKLVLQIFVESLYSRRRWVKMSMSKSGCYATPAVSHSTHLPHPKLLFFAVTLSRFECNILRTYIPKFEKHASWSNRTIVWGE